MRVPALEPVLQCFELPHVGPGTRSRLPPPPISARTTDAHGDSRQSRPQPQPAEYVVAVHTPRQHRCETRPGRTTSAHAQRSLTRPL